MSDTEVYGFCSSNCKFPVYTKEQTLAVLQQAIDAGSLAGIDPTQSPVVALIREKKQNKDISLWIGSEAEYNAIVPAVSASLVMGRIDENGQLYFCTDDSTLQDWHDSTLQEAREEMTAAAAANMQAVEEALANANFNLTSDFPLHLTVTAEGLLRITYDDGNIEE